MSKYVLDASALLALLNDEPGAKHVAAVLSEASIGAVNYAEAFGKLVETGMSQQLVTEAIDLLGLTVIDFDVQLARITASLRLETRKFGLSLGDRSCLALAMTRNCTALTADRLWSKLKIGVDIELIR